MAGEGRDGLYNRALELSRKADYIQIARACQCAAVGGFAGAAIGVGLHILVAEVVLGVVVGGVIGWKDAATQAYLLRAEASRLLDYCEVEDRVDLRERSKISYLRTIVRQRRSS